MANNERMNEIIISSLHSKHRRQLSWIFIEDSFQIHSMLQWWRSVICLGTIFVRCEHNGLPKYLISWIKCALHPPEFVVSFQKLCRSWNGKGEWTIAHIRFICNCQYVYQTYNIKYAEIFFAWAFKFTQ